MVGIGEIKSPHCYGSAIHRSDFTSLKARLVKLQERKIVRWEIRQYVNNHTGCNRILCIVFICYTKLIERRGL